MLKEYDLAGKVALVTGSGKGLGEQIALALAQAGANVAVVGRNHANLERVAKLIEAEGRKASAIVADVRSESEIAEAVAHASKLFGQIDVLEDAGR